MPVPADPKRPYKAYAATALAALSIFVTAWVADTDPFTAKEIAAAVVASLIGSGITGATTFAVRNPPKPVAGVVVDEGGYTNVLGLVVVVLVILILVFVLLRLA